MKKQYKILLIIAIAAIVIGGVIAYNPTKPQADTRALKIASSEPFGYFWEDSPLYEAPPKDTSQITSVWQEPEGESFIEQHNREVSEANQQARRQQEIASIEQELQRIRCCQQKAKTPREWQCLKHQQDRIIEELLELAGE